MVTFQQELAGGETMQILGKEHSKQRKRKMPREVEQAGGQCGWSKRGQRGDREPENTAPRGILRTLAFTSRLKVMIRGLGLQKAHHGAYLRRITVAALWIWTLGSRAEAMGPVRLIQVRAGVGWETERAAVSMAVASGQGGRLVCLGQGMERGVQGARTGLQEGSRLQDPDGLWILS